MLGKQPMCCTGVGRKLFIHTRKSISNITSSTNFGLCFGLSSMLITGNLKPSGLQENPGVVKVGILILTISYLCHYNCIKIMKKSE